MIDLSRIKPGDEVTVRAVVDSVRNFEGGAQLLVKVEDWRRTPATTDAWSYVGINIDQLTDHTPTALSVGDRVKAIHAPVRAAGFGIVRAIHEQRAWVERDDGGDQSGGFETWSVASLERA
jgi:hypothetical protein